jgi:hypothetical protein
MSRKMFAVVALALIAPVMAAKAQVSFGVAAGAAVPSGSFGDSFDMGYNLTALVAVSPPLSPVGLRVDGMFNEFNSKSTILGATQKYRISALTANAVFKAPGVIVLSPYLMGGLGTYNSKIASSSSSSNDFGWNLGGGIKFGLAGFAAFGEIRYHQIQSSGSSLKFIPITFGVMF